MNAMMVWPPEGAISGALPSPPVNGLIGGFIFPAPSPTEGNFFEATTLSERVRADFRWKMFPWWTLPLRYCEQEFGLLSGLHNVILHYYSEEL